MCDLRTFSVPDFASSVSLQLFFYSSVFKKQNSNKPTLSRSQSLRKYSDLIIFITYLVLYLRHFYNSNNT